MNNNEKSINAYKTIGEVTKELGLIDKKSGRLQTHTIRYWETQFKQIRPSIRAGKRRYYSNKVFKVIKHIKFLLKERGLTINGAKKILNMKESHSIDDDINIGINKLNIKTTKLIKKKVKNISKIIEELKSLK
jgi:DNA-binding transcriptional MerR regulator